MEPQENMCFQNHVGLEGLVVEMDNELPVETDV